jgi:hypothetical protein
LCHEVAFVLYVSSKLCHEYAPGCFAYAFT